MSFSLDSAGNLCDKFLSQLVFRNQSFSKEKKEKKILYIESSHHFCFLGKEFPPVPHPRRQSIILSSKNSQKLLLLSLLWLHLWLRRKAGLSPFFTSKGGKAQRSQLWGISGAAGLEPRSLSPCVTMTLGAGTVTDQKSTGSNKVKAGSTSYNFKTGAGSPPVLQAGHTTPPPPSPTSGSLNVAELRLFIIYLFICQTATSQWETSLRYHQRALSVARSDQPQKSWGRSRETS